MPIQSVKVPDNATLKFSFPKIKDPLYIHTGANEIKWSYHLNTVSYPTYGGEVIQALSTYVGPITISGNTVDNVQQKKIADWFRRYMLFAGYYGRTEEPILFEYPERGWSFWMQVTDYPDFHYAVDEIAIPWSVTGEIFQDNGLNTIATYTHSTFTESLMRANLQEVGFNAHDPRIDPNLNPAVNYHTMGDNFQRLIASYTAGDFQHWGFDILGNADEQFHKTADDIYKKAFGSEFLIPQDGASNTSSGSVTFGGPDTPSSRCGRAQMIASEFEAKGVPGALGVATAIVESQMDPDNRNSIGYLGMFQTKVSGKGGGGDNVEALRAAENSPGTKVTDNYTARMQAHDAAKWFKATPPSQNIDKNNLDQMAKWAQRAQVPCVPWDAPGCHDGYAPGQGRNGDFQAAYREAQRLISQHCAENNATGGNDNLPAPVGTPKHIIDTIVIPMAHLAGMKSGCNGAPITIASVTYCNHRHGHTVDGNVSDHEGPPARAWAADIFDVLGKGNKDPSANTQGKAALAQQLALQFNIPWSGAGVAENTEGGYRYQMLYKTDAGGGHQNHVHFGVRVA
jgi:hypothetical protein